MLHVSFLDKHNEHICATLFEHVAMIQSINQYTFSVFRTHHGTQQTIIGKMKYTEHLMFKAFDNRAPTLKQALSTCATSEHVACKCKDAMLAYAAAFSMQVCCTEAKVTFTFEQHPA